MYSFLFLSLFFKSHLTKKSRSDPSDLEHGHISYWNSASEEEAISETSRKGKEEMQDGAEEGGTGNSETCSATKKFLTEGLGCISRGLRLNCKCTLFCLQIQIESPINPHRKAETYSWRISWSNCHRKDSYWLPVLYGGQNRIFQWIFSSAADS